MSIRANLGAFIFQDMSFYNFCIFYAILCEKISELYLIKLYLLLNLIIYQVLIMYGQLYISFLYLRPLKSRDLSDISIDSHYAIALSLNTWLTWFVTVVEYFVSSKYH